MALFFGEIPSIFCCEAAGIAADRLDRDSPIFGKGAPDLPQL